MKIRRLWEADDGEDGLALILETNQDNTQGAYFIEIWGGYRERVILDEEDLHALAQVILRKVARPTSGITRKGSLS